MNEEREAAEDWKERRRKRPWVLKAQGRKQRADVVAEATAHLSEA